MRPHLSSVGGASALLLAAALSACAPDAPTAARTPALTGPALTFAIFEKPTKTATAYWRRDLAYDWTLVKSVAPAGAEIAAGSTATFNYTLTATRLPPTGTDAVGVSGQICVRNLGSQPSQGMVILDSVQVSTNGTTWTHLAAQTVDISANPTVEPGEHACYPYDIAITPVAGAQYRNRASVTWTNAGNGGVGSPGTTQTWETAYVPFTLPAEPTVGTETDEAATLADLLTCPTGFTCTPASGSWTLTGSQTIAYAVQVTNVSAPCRHTAVVENTAALTETDSGATRSDDESVTVTTPDCAPPPSLEGCTPGYWKQKQHFGSWVGYVPTGPAASRYNTVFGVSLFSANTTLLDALGTGGGGWNRLGRHSTAALLNTANGGVSYGMTPAQVIAAVQAAVASGNPTPAADMFEQLNERRCPLGRAE